MTSDSAGYKQKKAFFDSLLTVYGRKPVLEALQSTGPTPIKLHLSERNRSAPILDEILELALKKGADVAYHSPAKLSRISKNARQDQGVALDLKCPNFQTLDEFFCTPPESNCIIALDRVTNPQNLGMIIRSIAASPAAALIVPAQGCSPLNALVIKASAGTLFKAPVVQVEDLETALRVCREKSFCVRSLDVEAEDSLLDYRSSAPTIYVLGNETDGISPEIAALCDQSLKIPMQRGVESLNVAVTAALIAFLT